jgi:autotransporter-associated beta strand protein
MKYHQIKHHLRLLSATALATLPLLSNATVFFSDTFGSGSTLNSATPAAPTANSTAYQLSSSKTWVPTPAISSGDLKFGIGTTTSGGVEAQALFTTTPVALVLDGDFIRLTVTFTNTAGIQTANCLLGFGLYDSGLVAPHAGGLNATALNSVSDKATGGVQNWKGYWGQRGFTGQNSRIVLRQPQTGADNRNQNLTSTGSSSQSYSNPGGSTVGSQSTAPSGALVVGNTYTVVLTIQLAGANTLAITNTYYNGPDTNGTVVCEFGGVASGASYNTSSFDSIGIGWRAGANSTGGTVMDVSSITVDGSVTVITTPPDIITQPVPVSVASGGSCVFNVVAQGFGMTYQWHRYGTNLLNGGNISGATSDTLIITSASAADVASGANGYYVTVTGTGNYSTNSVTNSLTLVAAKNLIWNGSGTVWDLNTSLNWNDPINPALFNYGDSVTFDDTGAGNPVVTLNGSFLAASKWLLTGNSAYAFDGSGSFAGNGSLVFNSAASGSIQMNVANTHTGGTIISNSNPALNIYVQQYQVFGDGPVTLAKPGLMEIVPTGSATVGIKGDVAIQDDFTIRYDGVGAFATVFLGNLSGVSGKTLTLEPASLTTTNRIRVYGTATTCDANLLLNGPATPEAVYYGTTLASYHGSGVQVFNGVISGNGGFIQRAGGLTVLAGQNTYSGGTTPSTGTIGFGANTVGAVTSGPIGTGPLFINPEAPNTTGSGTVLAFGGARTIANPLQYSSATNNQTLIVAGTNDLTFSGPFTLNGNDATGTQTNRIIQINNTALTTISGVISGTDFGLTKTGTGTLALTGNNTYTGRTSVSNGTLRVNGTVAGAVLVAANSTLGGSGTINGDTTIVASGNLAPGNSIGTLTINNNLTLAGNLGIEVNRSGFASDKAIVSGTLANTGTGTVTVTNIGATLIAGDTFALFNKAVANGNALTVTGGGAVWTNNLAVDGTIAVVTPISSTPTNLSYSVTGNSLTLSWPLSHLTWTLQSNSVSVASSSSWFAVPNTANATQFVITVDPTKSNVFYRLVAP